jgi:hypothetical protein
VGSAVNGIVSVGRGVMVKVDVGVSVSVGETGVKVSVGAFVEVKLAVANCVAEAIGSCPGFETVHEIVLRNNKRSMVLFFIPSLYYRLSIQFWDTT